MRKLSLRIICSEEELHSFFPFWEELLSKISNANLYLDPDWIALWWKHFGKSRKLHVLCFFDLEKVVAVCPFMTSDAKSHKELFFIGAPIGGNMDFIVDPDYREDVFRALSSYFADPKEPFIFYLRGFPEDSPNFKSLKEALKAQGIPFYVSHIKNYFLKPETADFDAYLRRRFSKSSIKALERKSQRLRGIGRLELRKGDSRDMEAAFAIHDLRWERKSGTSNFSKGAARDFFLELARRQETAFMPLLYLLTLDGVAISYIYLFAYKGHLLLKRIGHDDTFHLYSPGSLLLQGVMKECFAADPEMISFGIGEDEYKKKWTDDYYHVHSISFSSKHAIPRSIWTLKRAVYFFRDKIRGNRTVLKALRKFAGRAKYAVRQGKTARPKALDRYSMLSLIKSIYSRRHYTVVGKRLEEPRVKAGSAPQIPELGYRDFAMGDLLELAALMKCRPEEIIDRLDQQVRCCLLLEKDRIVACAWFVPGRIVLPQIPYRKTINPAELYLAEAFPEFPGRGSIEMQQRLLEHYLYQKGFRKMYYTVSTGLNSSSPELNSSYLGTNFPEPVRGKAKYSFTVTTVLGKIKAVRTL